MFFLEKKIEILPIVSSLSKDMDENNSFYSISNEFNCRGSARPSVLRDIGIANRLINTLTRLRAGN